MLGQFKGFAPGDVRIRIRSRRGGSA